MNHLCAVLSPGQTETAPSIVLHLDNDLQKGPGTDSKHLLKNDHEERAVSAERSI